MNLSTSWWFAFAIWPALALAASLADWSWHRHSFTDELAYHLFGDLCLMLAATAVPFLLQRQRRRPEHLQALEAELHPHFLFNTLNSIATLMHEDVDAADEMMAKLATLLRRTMDRQGAVEIPLREELEMLEIYLDIQRTRLRRSADHRGLGCARTRSTSWCRACCCNRWLRMPYATASAAAPAQGASTVRAESPGNELRLTVTNDGAGWPAQTTSGGGLGLKNTRARLKRFDRRCVFDLREGGDQGAVAVDCRCRCVDEDPDLDRG